MYHSDVLASMKRPIPKECRKFGAAVRIRRRALGLSQEEFAEKVDCHRNFVGRIERGEQNPTVDTLVRIARALRCKISDLFFEAGL
ncbi:MAG: helix-turn-helix domain-containing protein [Kiritimatiellia bacterium]|jgi:transcriptional regulator with XRE-family HTH domain